MEDLYDAEEKLICPYNPSHHIRRCKMAFHLVKCKKNYPQVNMVPCDFNATHMIPQPELKYHHQLCPDRKKVEACVMESQNKSETKFPIATPSCASDENWDNLNVKTYDPQKYAEDHNLLRRLDVEPNSKKKNFRLSERLRLTGMSTASTPPPAEELIALPAHRAVTSVAEDSSSRFRDKLKLESNKVFLQSRCKTPKE